MYNSNEPNIKYLFEPQSVVVIGASSQPTKIGHRIVENIVTGGYKGDVYPVNPRGGEIFGLPMYPDLNEIEGEIDLACIAVPAGLVFDVVKQCAEKRVKFLSIISSGFSEVGNAAAEKEIVAHARAHGMRILGPNIFGIYSARASLNATFGPDAVKAGNVAIITQSGALGIAMIGKTAVENIGLSAIASVGNKADLNEADLLEYLVQQEETRVVMMYIEGVKAGKRLIEVLEGATRQKPVVVIKSGRSQRGAIAAASHTGSLAGADEIFDDIMRQVGVLRAESLGEAFDWCKFLADTALPAGENTVIITNGGGIGVMATDACEKYDVKLYDDAHILKEIFSSVTPDFGSTRNPVDLTGQATPADYDAALGAALKRPEIHAVIGLYCETAVFDAASLSQMIQRNDAAYKAGKKPLLFSILGGEQTEESLDALRKQRVPVFPDVYEAVSALGGMYAYRRHRQSGAERTEMTPFLDAAHLDAIESVIDGALRENRSFLLAHEGQRVMKAAGVPTPKSAMARSLDDAVKAAEGMGYPVVMKIVSRDILHKSDAGGVALDLENREEVIDAYQAIIRNCRAYKPDAIIEGVEVSEMVQLSAEVIVGARKDATYGPIVMFGLGGIYVEVMKDVSFRAAPLNRGEATRMIKETRSYPILLGVRGAEPRDIEQVIDVVLKLSELIQKCERITDIEINPLVVYERGGGVKAVDVRILVENRKGVGSGE
jgi:acetyltransferase